MNKKFIYWFTEINKDFVDEVGGKGANLGEMTSFGMTVPPGFVISAEAYRHFLKENHLEAKIHQILDHLDTNNPETLGEVSRQVKKLIKSAEVPDKLAKEIIAGYLKLGKQVQGGGNRVYRILRGIHGRQTLVAVRSSATSEDSKEASFAGQNETFLNISGEANVVEAVKNCWASLFDARSIFYRQENHFDHFKSYIAVVVQIMVPSEISGVMFSIDPVTNNRTRVVIEAVWGLGETIVQGKATPDHYEVNKSDLFITENRLADQKIQLVRNHRGITKEEKVPLRNVSRRKLTDTEIKELAKLSIDLEKHYYFPQDSEFAVFQGKIFLVQTRPITTTNSGEKREESRENKAEQEKELRKLDEILNGAPASPGIKSGPVKVLKSVKEIGNVLAGDVLVAEQTNPDYVPAMKKATAIVTDKGGRTSHAAIVSRELGIPCVVGTGNATKILKTGMVVTVNGGEGKVYKGALKMGNVQSSMSNNNTANKKRETYSIDTNEGILKTATKVYVNLAEPDKAKEIAARNVDGVGLLRAEFMLAGIGIHPKEAIRENKQKEYIAKLTEQLTTFAEVFYPRPVVYRATDFKTNEYRTLKGGEKYEPQEENPMIGFRGAYRYMVQPEVFKMEIETIKEVRNKCGFKNLWLMIPFCRTVKELAEVKKIMGESNLHRSPSFKLWMMCEIPANVILLDKFIEEGLDGISIGSNDLTMLTLGVDRDNENVAKEYNERNEALLWSFERIIKICKEYNVTCSMCGQAPSDYPELTERLVELGITSVSVNPDVIEKTREIVYEAERRSLSHANGRES